MPRQTRRSRKRLHRRRKTRRHRGGVYVASGTYGCGFRPALRCEANNARRPGIFSKLTYSKEADKEIALRDILSVIDPGQALFLYPTEQCKPKAAPDPENHVERCKLGEKSVLPNYPHMRILQMPDGGVAPDRRGLAILSPNIPLFLASFINIFNGLIALHNSDLFHNDIKTTNITVGEAGGQYLTRLIDFGMMVSPQGLDRLAKDESSGFHNYGVFKTSYAYHSFDVKFLDPDDFEPSNFYDEAPDADEIAAIEAEKTALNQRGRELRQAMRVYKDAIAHAANAEKPAIQAQIAAVAQELNDVYKQYVVKNEQKQNLQNFSIDDFYRKAVEYASDFYPHGIFLNDDDDVTRRIDIEYVASKHDALAGIPADLARDGAMLAGLAKGSPEYAAMLEKMKLIARQRSILRASDIYALGHVLSEIVCKLLQQRDTGVEAPEIHTNSDVYHETNATQMWLEALIDNFTQPFFELIRKMMDPVYDPPPLEALRDEYVTLVGRTPALLGGNTFAAALAGPHPYYTIITVPAAAPAGSPMNH